MINRLATMALLAVAAVATTACAGAPAATKTPSAAPTATIAVPTATPAVPNATPAIAITTAKRNPALPDTPTVGDTVKGYDVTHWYGIWGPKNLSKEIVTRWNQEVSKIIRSDSVRKFLATEGLEAAGGPPEEFRDRIKNDSEKWIRVVKEAKIVVN